MAAPEPKPLVRGVREYDIAQDFGNALTQTARVCQQALSAELAPHGVTVRQSQVLGWLRKKRELSQCQLASFLTIEPATLAGVLERMERDGLIHCITDQSDCRRKLIRLNRHAKKLGDTVVKGSARGCARAMKGLSPVEVDLLLRLLKRVVANLANH